MKSAASVVSGIAAGQWGLLTTAQAEATGVNRSSLARMCDRGLVRRLVLTLTAVSAIGVLGLALGHATQPWVQALVSSLQQSR